MSSFVGIDIGATAFEVVNQPASLWRPLESII